MSTEKNIIVSFIILATLKFSNSQLLGLSENSPCGNAGGTCRRLRDCPIIGNPRQSRPLLCSFIDREPVVCCPPSRAQEMCIKYDRMACNAVDIARRRRDIEVDNEDEIHLSSEGAYTESDDLATSTTLVYQESSSHTIHTTNRVTTEPTVTRMSTAPLTMNISNNNTTTFSTTMSSKLLSHDQKTNDTLVGEEGSLRMLIGGLTSVDNDLAETKVVGGTAANPMELPYMALIGYGTTTREWSCGASIISEFFVMSAAHCASNSVLGPARWARVGELDLSRENSPHQDIPIVARHVHPGYSEPAVYNDIAVFRLGRRLVFSAWIQPICLQVAPTIMAARGVAAGWGRTDFVGDTSERLLKVDLTLVDAAQCRALLGRAGRFLPQGVNMDTMICAGEREGGKDTCTGDSGGPLVVKGTTQCVRTQIGVVSFGRQCAMPNTPGIYTKVSSFVPWIESIVWPN